MPVRSPLHSEVDIKLGVRIQPLPKQCVSPSVFAKGSTVKTKKRKLLRHMTVAKFEEMKERMEWAEAQFEKVRQRAKAADAKAEAALKELQATSAGAAAEALGHMVAQQR